MAERSPTQRRYNRHRGARRRRHELHRRARRRRRQFPGGRAGRGIAAGSGQPVGDERTRHREGVSVPADAVRRQESPPRRLQRKRPRRESVRAARTVTLIA